MPYKILPATGVRTDFNNWSSFQNRYGSEEYTPKKQLPKALIQSAIREFEQFCKDYHIDASQYQTIEPCEIDGDWRQFDFIDSQKHPSKISVHSIAARADGTILQRVIDVA